MVWHKLLTVMLLTFLAYPAGCPADDVDLIVNGGTIVTMDAEYRVFSHAALAIRGDRIVAIGDRAEISRNYRAETVVDASGGIILPGLVNTHTHIPMTLFRGAADDTKLLDWLNGIIWPLEKEFVDAEMLKWGTLLGCWEMLRTGTTTFADSYFQEDLIANVVAGVGMRAVCGHGASDLEAAEEFLKSWKGHPLITAAVAPHSVYTVDAEKLRNAKALADRHEALLMIHAAESLGELEYSSRTHNATPVAFLHRLGILDSRVLLAHAIWLDDAELGYVKDQNVGIAHCPESNMTLGSGVAPISTAWEQGIEKIGLGTDGAASNQTLDLFEEMNLAAKLQKVFHLDPTNAPARKALAMATIAGARAIGLDRDIGSLEVGKKADIITITIDYPSLIPFYDVYSLLVYATRGHNVNTAIVNGKILMENRKFTTLDTPAIVDKAQEFQERIYRSLVDK